MTYDIIRYILWYDMMICFLTAIVVTPGDCSTVHMYTKTIQRTKTWNRIPRTETLTIRIPKVYLYEIIPVIYTMI
jgi:hypothetical protein